MIFDGIATNINCAYQVNNSIFLCPVNGIYAFTATILSTEGRDMLGSIMVEDMDKGGFQARAVEGVRQTGSHFVIIECNAWERVWVKGKQDGCRMYGAYNYSTFSGFLIYRY